MLAPDRPYENTAALQDIIAQTHGTLTGEDLRLSGDVRVTTTDTLVPLLARFQDVSHLGSARWIRKHIDAQAIGGEANSLVALFACACAGLGVAALPCYMAASGGRCGATKPRSCKFYLMFKAKSLNAMRQDCRHL